MSCPFFSCAQEGIGIANDECGEFIALAMVDVTAGVFLPGGVIGYFGWI
jgi:hypothetical protein